jgi:hypothetical protein
MRWFEACNETVESRGEEDQSGGERKDRARLPVPGGRVDKRPKRTNDMREERDGVPVIDAGDEEDDRKDDMGVNEELMPIDPDPSDRKNDDENEACSGSESPEVVRFRQMRSEVGEVVRRVQGVDDPVDEH